MRIDSIAINRLTAASPTDTMTPLRALPTAEGANWNVVRAAVVPVNTATLSASAARTTNVQLAQGTAAAPLGLRTQALLAQDVYADRANPPAGFRVATGADLNRLGINPATLENPASGFRARVYVEGSGANARYVVAFRGSQQLGDWIANGQQALGLPSDHYNRALQIGQSLARARGVDVELVGHSLGGGLASAAAVASGREATTFNASGLSDTVIGQANAIRTANGGGAAPRVDAYFVRGEVLSAIQDGGDRVAGGLVGFFTGGVGGAIRGAIVADAPEAYGTRRALDAVRPSGTPWYGDNPVARHGMDWVLSSVGNR